jgi:flagellar biosynthesis protein FliQ
MADAVFQLYVLAMSTTLELAMPVIVTVAFTGIAVSLIQTTFGIQDQNVTFAPKIAVVAFLLVGFGTRALSAILHIFTAALASVPRLVG